MLTMAKLSEVLQERGYVYQFSSEKLEEITDGPKRTLYLGIDPSADSLHIGQLQAMLVLRRFLEDGHKVVLLIGGGTGMIGDPSGRSEERNLLDLDTVAKNGKAIAAQATRLFGDFRFEMTNNADWLLKLNLVEFLRDIGKNFTVNSMVKREMVAERLKSESPISYTEFAYAPLQAYDYLHLHKENGCDLQVGGSDQWGNIASGVELIRKMTGDAAYAFTWPLIVNKATGKKFGKSEQGAVWLDAEKTSPFQMYQFLLGSEDEAVEEYLLKLTLLSKTEIDAVMMMHKRSPKERHAQRLLAREVTAIVHGKDVAEKAENASAILFGDAEISAIDTDMVHMLLGAAPSCDVAPGAELIDVLVQTQLASSKREARQFVEGQAVSLNAETIGDTDRKIEKSDFKNGIALLKRGKRNVCILRQS